MPSLLDSGISGWILYSPVLRELTHQCRKEHGTNHYHIICPSVALDQPPGDPASPWFPAILSPTLHISSLQSLSHHKWVIASSQKKHELQSQILIATVLNPRLSCFLRPEESYLVSLHFIFLHLSNTDNIGQLKGLLVKSNALKILSSYANDWITLVLTIWWWQLVALSFHVLNHFQDLISPL